MGQKTPRTLARWHAQLNGALGEALGQVYVSRYFRPRTRPR